MKEQSKGIHIERLTIRISHELFEEIRKYARAKQMSVSSFVREAILSHIQAHYYVGMFNNTAVSVEIDPKTGNIKKVFPIKKDENN